METSESWTRMENLPANRYLFNGGSEWNSRVGIYETYYRGYDPALGRMTSIDPMALKYSSISPYNFAFNNPVNFLYPPKCNEGGSSADPFGTTTTYTETTSSGYKFVDYWEVEYTPCGCGVVNEYAIDGSYHITPGSGNHYSDEFMSTYGDYFLMSGSDFNVKYGLPNGTDVRIKNGQVGYYVKSTGWSGFEVYDKYGDITQMMHFTLVNTFVEVGQEKYNYSMNWRTTWKGQNNIISNTDEAKEFYENGDGSPRLIDYESSMKVVNSPEFQRVINRLVTGIANQISSSFDVDMTSDVFHIGRTNVDYSTYFLGNDVYTKFSLFVRDGFWDPNFIAEKFSGLNNEWVPDGMGPNLETEGSHPYEYVPVILIIKYVNPGTYGN